MRESMYTREAPVKDLSEDIKISNLSLNLPVRKEGRTTGLSYGVVAGVYGGFKPKAATAVLSEYYVLEEKDRLMNYFAKKETLVLL